MDNHPLQLELQPRGAKNGSTTGLFERPIELFKLDVPFQDLPQEAKTKPALQEAAQC